MPSSTLPSLAPACNAGWHHLLCFVLFQRCSSCCSGTDAVVGCMVDDCANDSRGTPSALACPTPPCPAWPCMHHRLIGSCMPLKFSPAWTVRQCWAAWWTPAQTSLATSPGRWHARLRPAQPGLACLTKSILSTLSFEACLCGRLLRHSQCIGMPSSALPSLALHALQAEYCLQGGEWSQLLSGQ